MTRDAAVVAGDWTCCACWSPAGATARSPTRLDITEGTVKLHVSSILGKLGAADRTEAVTRALQRGIVQLQM